jgi:hypothetical protein
MARIDTTEAANRLGITGETVRAYVRLGWLDGKTASGETGRGKPFFFDSDEIEAFRRGGAPAAKAYRESRDLDVKPKRGRKVGAR